MSSIGSAVYDVLPSIFWGSFSVLTTSDYLSTCMLLSFAMPTHGEINTDHNYINMTNVGLSVLNNNKATHNRLVIKFETAKIV